MSGSRLEDHRLLGASCLGRPVWGVARNLIVAREQGSTLESNEESES